MKKSKLFSIALIVILMIGILSCCAKRESIEKTSWEDIELSQYIPKPEKFNGDITTDRNDLTIFKVEGMAKNEYKDYVQQCIDMGYNIDLEYENWDTVYGAFNNEGYSLRIIYDNSSNTINVTVKVPETQTMKDIEWPSNGLAAIVPTPQSTLGDISWNNNKQFIAHLGNTSKDAYDNYVKQCENHGFTIDFSKGDKSYSALNSDGYKLHLMYLGANVIEISIKAPKETAKTQDKNNAAEINPKFKSAMDKYEKFFDEYVAIMKKYANNPTDMSILSDYTKYMGQYADMMKEFEKLKDEDLNTAEMAYYVEVQGRITKKILEVTQ